MKNSPGSMIGGIGLTTWVRDVQLVRTIPMTSSTSASSTPRMIVAFDCLRKPPELWSRVARNSLSSRALTRFPASSLWTMATTSFTRGVSRPRATVVNGQSADPAPRRVPLVLGVRCGLRPPDRVQECLVSNDGQTSDPRASLSPAIQAIAAAATLETMLEAVLGAAVSALDPSMGAVFVSDPDRPGLQLVASHGMDDAAAARLAIDVEDPADPFTTAAVSRTAIFDREAAAVDGAGFVGAYLPLVVASGGVDTVLGSMGFGWPAPHVLDATDRDLLTALAALAALAVDRTRLASTAAERSEWFERMAHTDPLTGLANERTIGRVLELELARASRQASEVSLAMFDVDD